VTVAVLTKHCHRHCHFKLTVSRQTMTQNELRGSTTKLSKIEFTSANIADDRLARSETQRFSARLAGRQRMSSHVSYWLSATCQQAVQNEKIVRLARQRLPQKLARSPDSASPRLAVRAAVSQATSSMLSPAITAARGQKTDFSGPKGAADIRPPSMILSASGLPAIEPN